MAKGYWVGRINVSGPDEYAKYVAANAEPFARYGARFLVRGGALECVEGASRDRNVVIEFPSYEAALECWNSTEYQRARGFRDGAAEVDLIVIQGYDGPQPTQGAQGS